MRKTRRTSKVGELVRDALVEVFRFDMKDLPLGLASITGVEVSPDLHYARVFISGLEEDQTRATVKRLHGASGKLRKFLGQRIRLRYTPELDFQFDETTMRASRIESILQEVKAKDAKDADERAAEAGDATLDDDDSTDSKA